MEYFWNSPFWKEKEKTHAFYIGFMVNWYYKISRNGNIWSRSYQSRVIATWQVKNGIHLFLKWFKINKWMNKIKKYEPKRVY